MNRHEALLLGCILVLPVSIEAHLCNDVFMQAKDNLAVKVDIRDGQLRIGQNASFKVYVLNTMDREIVDINLEVKSDHFDAVVAPAETWRTFPVLKAVRGGGKKEFFTVSLTRKPGVPDGKYEIGLRFFNGRKSTMEFKTVDLAAAAATHSLDRAPKIAVNGAATKGEWDNSILCTDFYDYRKAAQFLENFRVAEQPRFRVSASAKDLYLLLTFYGHDNAEADTANIYIATSGDSDPVKIDVDRVTGKASGTHAEAVEVGKSQDGMQVECRIPRSAVGLGAAAECLLNFSRTVRSDGRETTTYWRGNKYSVSNPIVYDRFLFPK